jgi:hypothetical protein
MSNLGQVSKNWNTRYKKVMNNPWEALSDKDLMLHSATKDDLTDAFTPEVPEQKDEPIIPIPDERSASLAAKKRKAKTKNTGRSSTILTEGLGG